MFNLVIKTTIYRSYIPWNYMNYITLWCWFTCRWSAIAAQLPGRTDNEIKNHWHTNLKKRLSEKSVEATRSCSDDDKGQEKDTGETEVNKQIPANSAQIIESSSSALSPQASSGDFSTTDNIAATNMDLVSDDDLSFLEAYEIPSGNFWTEPFLSDDYFMPNDFLAPLVNPDSPIFDGEISSPFAFINTEDYNLYWNQLKIVQFLLLSMINMVLLTKIFLDSSSWDGFVSLDVTY